MESIRELCEKHKVTKLFFFGSYLTGTYNDNSDIDVVVEFTGVDLYDYADNYFSLKAALEKLLKRPIDLLEDQAIKNPSLRESIDSEKEMVYG